MDLDFALATRQSLRETVDEVIGETDAIDDSALPGHSTLLELRDTLEDTGRELQQLDKTISPNYRDDDLKAELTEIRIFNRKCSKAKAKLAVWLRKYETSSQVESPPPDNDNTQRSSAPPDYGYHLPRIEIKKFSGAPLGWASFWDQFSKCVHENSRIPKVNKLVHLRSFLGGSALSAISGLPIVDTNYDVAIALLKKRFDNREIAAQDHLERIVSGARPVSSTSDVTELRKLLDFLGCHVMALENLDVNMEAYAMTLYSTLIKVIPSEIALDFERRKRERRNVQVDNEISMRMTPSVASSIAGDRAEKCKELLEFFQNEVEARETFALVKGVAATVPRNEPNKQSSSRRGQNGSKHNYGNGQSRERREPHGSVPYSGSALAVTGDRYNMCMFCSGTHDPKKCTKAMTNEERVEAVRNSGRCFRCLGNNHRSKDCKNRTIKCDKCSKMHLTIMHNEEVSSANKPPIGHSGSSSDGAAGGSGVNASENNTQASTACVVKRASSGLTSVLLQTATGDIYNERETASRKTRLLFDSGSQHTFISSKLARALNLPIADRVDMNIYTFGSQTPLVRSCNVVSCSVKSKLDGGKIEFLALELNDLGLSIELAPNPEVVDAVSKLQLTLADESFASDDVRSSEVQILVGGDNINKFVTGKRVVVLGGLSAVETKLNWTLIGPISNASTLCNTTRILCVETRDVKNDVSMLWELERIGIEDPSSVGNIGTASDDQKAVEHFDATVERLANGRYGVALPWRCSAESLASNYGNAANRARSAVRKLSKSGQFDRYALEIGRYLKDDHAELVGNGQSSVGGRYYMPHHPVFREDKETTKLRVVFDCSAKSGDSKSLNDMLLAGPNLNPDLTGLLINFRRHRVALTGDIEKAFLQVEIQPPDRDYLRYLWQNEHGEENTYRMKVLPFGLTCSPFLLASVVKHHVAQYSESSPEAVLSLTQALYVDDLLTGAHSTEQAAKLHRDCSAIMSDAGMNLRKWTTNDSSLQARIGRCEIGGNEVGSTQKGVFKVLGITWDVHDDHLVIAPSIPLEQLDKVPTKRFVLKITASIFDPLGLIAPFLTTPKLLLQSLWSTDKSWDEPIEGELEVAWRKWSADISLLSNIRIPRFYGAGLESEMIGAQLHIFCDASEKAYAAAAYLRVTDGVNTRVTLVMSKTRVAPVKRVTIPRLELLGTVIATRLRQHLLKVSVVSKDLRTYMWTDSTIALCWVRGRSQDWQTFVANRVDEVQRYTEPDEWRHCPGVDNPADLPTRGLSAQQLSVSTLWWQGPAWLDKDESEWPSNPPGQIPAAHKDEVQKEKKKVEVLVHVTRSSEALIDVNSFSSFTKLVRVVATVYRFVERFKSSESKPSGPFSAEELSKAKIFIFAQAQRECFANDISAVQKAHELPEKSPLSGYSPYIDSDGLLRIGGRLEAAPTLTSDQKHPVVLPANNRIVDLFIKWEHRRLAHVGVTTLLSHIRDKFWIIRGRQQIKSVLRKCIFCKKFEGPSGVQQTAPLPSDRVRETPPFETVGIDFAGPLYVTAHSGTQRKSYICLITCAVTRAVHLELVSNLETASFLSAFRRFISRRGVPRIIYSDNALTFQRASKDLAQLWKSLKDKATASFFAEHGIVWKFIMPRSPWWGGFYERLVRTIKASLRKILGRALLDFEGLSTVLTEVEALVNSRPLTQTLDDPREPQVLTPACILLGRRLTQLPPGNMVSEVFASDRGEINKGWIRRKQLVSDFWKRWRSEYLLLLKSAHQRPRTGQALVPKVGDVVLIFEDNRPRLMWKTALVTEHFMGRDGLVRSVGLRLPSGTLMKRSVQLVHPLEIV